VNNNNSTNYNSVERKIAILLSDYPRIKLLLKIFYQYLNYFVYRKPIKYYSNYSMRSYLPKGSNESFFGYYDKSPVNLSGDFIIFHSTNHNTINKPNPDKKVNIVLYSVKSNKYKIVCTSFAYNWQQGSKLQWINDTCFIYNDYDHSSNCFFSNIFNVSANKIQKTIPYPIYDCYKDKFALSLNFDRLALLRPDYGYRNRLKNIDNGIINNLENDGIIYVDLETNQKRLLYEYKDIIKLNNNKKMDTALHKLNHINISPDGRTFIFLHRYFYNGVKYDRLILGSLSQPHLKLLSDHQMVSHNFWYGNDKIISFMRREDCGDKYYVTDILSGNIRPITEGIIDNFGDGHPNIFKDKMVFDTYPNKSRMKELYLFDMSTSILTRLGEFFESLKYRGETRCDLHPRFSFDGDSIFFDSVHTGKRRLYSINLKNE